MQRSWGQIQLRIAFMPDSRPFWEWPDGVLVGWNGLPLLLLPCLVLEGVENEDVINGLL